MASDPWTVLGVEPSASYARARRAYLIRSQLLHPDRHQDAGPGVLAEAERAMRELNEAWNLVRSGLAQVGTPGRREQAEAGGPPPELTHRECLDWVVGRLADTARGRREPLLAVEIDRLRLPVAAAPTGRRFERWLAERRLTLRAAMADDARLAGGSERWATAVRVLAESGPLVVFMLLLDRRPPPF